MAVYFACAKGTDLVKIGYAVNVKRRIDVLQAGCPYTLTVARVIDGDQETEAAVHRHYRRQVFAREWFRWSDDMLEVVAPPPRARTALHRAVEICGGQSALARKIGKRQSFVSMALHRGKVSLEACPSIEEATNGQVTRRQLRPDFAWDAPAAPQQASAA